MVVGYVIRVGEEGNDMKGAKQQKKGRKRRTTFFLDVELLEWLHREAERRGVTMAFIVSESLEWVRKIREVA
jgi:hypothetical protein